MEVSVQFHAPADLPLGKNLRYPLCRRLGGSQSRSGLGVKRKKSHHCLLPGIEPRWSMP